MNKIYPNGQFVNRTAEFAVTDKPVVLRLFNVSPTDVLQLEQVVRFDCEPELVSPVNMCCPIVMNTNRTLMVFSIPGTYRFMITGVPFNDDLVVVVDDVAISSVSLPNNCC